MYPLVKWVCLLFLAMVVQTIGSFVICNSTGSLPETLAFTACRVGFGLFLFLAGTVGIGFTFVHLMRDYSDHR